MKKLLMAVLMVSIVSPSFAFANGNEGQKGNGDSHKVSGSQMTAKNEKSSKIEQKGKAEMKTEVKKEEKKTQKDNREQNKAQKQIALVTKRLDAAVARVQKLSDRVSARLDIYATQGVNVDVSRAHLADAKVKLALATAKISEITAASTAVVSSIATSTATSTVATTTPVTVSPKEALRNIQALVKDITTTIQGAQHDVSLAISSIKPGRDHRDSDRVTPVAATTTPVVVTPASTSTSTSTATSTTN